MCNMKLSVNSRLYQYFLGLLYVLIVVFVAVSDAAGEVRSEIEKRRACSFELFDCRGSAFETRRDCAINCKEGTGNHIACVRECNSVNKNALAQCSADFQTCLSNGQDTTSADELELADAHIIASEEAEDLNILLLPDEGPKLPIDELTSIPPEPAVMGQCIDQAYAQEQEVGYAYAIVKNGQLAFSNGGGWARAPWETNSPSVPMTENKPLTIASVSKPLTAVAVMKLLEQQPNVNLDTPFYPLIKGKFNGPFFFSDGVLINIPGPGVDQVTIRNLLMHRSGLKAGLGCGFGNLAKLLGIGVIGTPGVTYNYENSNFCLLREVIEAVSNKDYIDYVQTNVLQPMGITEMSCEREAVDPTLYYNTIGDPGFLWGDYVSTCSAYGWYASAINLAQFLANVRFNTVLSAGSTDEMLNTSCPGPSGYCLGWTRTDGSIGVHHWHSGDWIDGNPCKTQGSLDDITAQPSDCKKGYNGTIMHFPLDIDGVLLVNTRGGTGFNPSLKSEVTILRECFAEAFLDANKVAVPLRAQP